MCAFGAGNASDLRTAANGISSRFPWPAGSGILGHPATWRLHVKLRLVRVAELSARNPCAHGSESAYSWYRCDVRTESRNTANYGSEEERLKRRETSSL